MWWVYDAKWQCPFQSAPVIIRHLQGLHKPIYHPLGACVPVAVVLLLLDTVCRNISTLNNILEAMCANRILSCASRVAELSSLSRVTIHDVKSSQYTVQ